MLDDDDSALSHTHDSIQFSRDDSEGDVAEMFLPNRSDSSPVHRSHSYTDNLSSVAGGDGVTTSVVSATAATAASTPGRSEAHNRPRSASVLTRPRLPFTAEGQSSTADLSASDHRGNRRLRSCESAPSTTTTTVVDDTRLTESRADSDDTETEAAPTCDVTESDVSGGAARLRLNQRRAVRAERRYHTADTIQNVDHDSAAAIHKRLSLNYGGQQASATSTTLPLPECSTSAALSCESLASMPSSSGVSSTASLYHATDDDTATSADVESTALPEEQGLAESQTDDVGGLTAGQRLQLVVSEGRRLNPELLLMNSALEAS